MPLTAGFGFGVAFCSKLAGEFLNTKEKFYLGKYILANNTVHDFKKMYQKNLEDNIHDQNDFKMFVDLYN